MSVVRAFRITGLVALGCLLGAPIGALVAVAGREDSMAENAWSDSCPTAEA